MDARSSLLCSAVVLFSLSAGTLAHGIDTDLIECGFDERVAMMEALILGTPLASSCTSPQMTLAVVFTTHQRIMQDPGAEWPDSTYLTGMLGVETEFEDYVSFVSSGRTNMDVRVIKREGADSVYAWVIADSMVNTNKTAITNKINAGQASAIDSTFYKNADGIFYFFGHQVDGALGAAGLGGFCGSQGIAYAQLGWFYDDGSGSGITYHVKWSNGSAHGWWATALVHECGHLFGLNHTPNSGNVNENFTCSGCMGCFAAAMVGITRSGCPLTPRFDYIPYHGLHLQQLGWADFVSISRDTTLYVRDFRDRPLIYKVKPVEDHNDFFAFYNLQRTEYDSVVAGEGLAIMHAVDRSPELEGWTTRDIWDMEIPQPMYTKTTINTNCPALPYVENPAKGVDTLQCWHYGGEAHLWPYPETSVSSFGDGTNPWTKLYVPTAMSPQDSQSVFSGLCMTTESLADSFITGKEMVKVVVDIGCNTPPPPGLCPVVYQGEPGQMTQVNNVLSRCFQSIPNGARRTSDLLVLSGLAPGGNGQYDFSLREERSDFSAFDAVELQVFDVADGAAIVSTTDARPLALTADPLQATTVVAVDGIPEGTELSPSSMIHATAGAIVEYEWQDLPPAMNAVVLLEPSLKPHEICEICCPDDCDNLMTDTGRMSGTGLLVDQWVDTFWQPLGDLVPRIHWDHVALELPESAGGMLRLRIRWEGTHDFRMIGWVAESMEIEPSFRLQPLEVEHSESGSLGDVMNIADGIPALLTRGDTISFAFDAPPVTEGTERRLALQFEGRYSNRLEGLGSIPTSGVGPVAVSEPRETAIAISSPNPFNPATAWKLDLATGSPVTLRVYDAEGRLVRQVVDQQFPAGVHTVRWNGRNDQGQTVGSGVYFWRFEGAGLQRGDKFVVLK